MLIMKKVLQLDSMGQSALIITFMLFSWLMMQVVHEMGHVIGAWLTGGEVTRVALHPFIFSRTDLEHNPHPLIVVWAGAVFGVVGPLLVLLVAKWLRSPGLYLFRFFAGFCCMVNGIYISCFPVDGMADPSVMIEYGSPRWALILFGVVTVPLGFYLWHRQGARFGLGDSEGHVNRSAVIVSCVLLVCVVGLELLFNSL
ncbi:MAG: hypothetical protein ACI9TH_002816 [Kiritimatiellia bacterium]|jgi:hypothetical protein